MLPSSRRMFINSSPYFKLCKCRHLYATNDFKSVFSSLEIYECAKEKPVLHESILEMLYEQLSKYLREDDGGAPLDIDKCVQTHAITAVLTVSCVSITLNKASISFFCYL